MTGATNSPFEALQTKHQSTTVLRCKVAVVGASHVGKTALLKMFHSEGQDYPKNYVMTAGLDFRVKTVHIPDTNVDVELFLFDHSGQTIYNQLEDAKVHWKDCSAAVVIYDIADKDSFQSCSKWLADVRAARQKGDLPCIIVGNKCDLSGSGREAVTKEDGAKFAKQHKAAFFTTSAFQDQSGFCGVACVYGSDMSRPFSDALCHNAALYDPSKLDNTAVAEPFIHIAKTFHARYEKFRADLTDD